MRHDRSEIGVGGRQAGGVGPQDKAGPVSVPEVDGGLVAPGDHRDRVGQDLECLGEIGESGQLLAEGQQRPGGGIAPTGVAQHRAHVEHIARVPGEEAKDPLFRVGVRVVRTEELGDASVASERRGDVDHPPIVAGLVGLVEVPLHSSAARPRASSGERPR